MITEDQLEQHCIGWFKDLVWNQGKIVQRASSPIQGKANTSERTS